MNTFVVLIRGINVGGKNKVSMAELKKCLETAGYTNVLTYIASGNVLIQSEKQPDQIKNEIENMLPKNFRLDSKQIKVEVLTPKQLRSVIDNKPKKFGDQPEKYHSDVVFLIGITVPQAITVFKPKEGVDMVWPGKEVIYVQRLSALRTQSHLSKIIGTPEYQSMTIRNWNTTTKLVELVKAMKK